MFAKSLLVSYDGADMFACGNWTNPCRTIRYAVTISTSSDEVLIKNVQNKPYEECERSEQLSPGIKINKSLSFIGVNGTAVIQCKRGSELFIIQSPTSNSTRISISNLVLSTADALIRCEEGSRFELLLRHCVFKNFYAAVVAKLATVCSMNVFNCTFHGNIYPSIVTSCSNLTARLVGSTFLASSVSLRTFSTSASTVRWQFTEVFISHCGFYGQQKQMCSALLKVSPSSAVANITVELSEFKNHKGDCQHSQVSTVNIYGDKIGKRTQTMINLNKLLFESNYCTGAMIRLIPIYIRGTTFKVGITNSMFKNTTASLDLTFNGKKHTLKGPSLVLRNNTFFKTYKVTPNTWSNIILGNGKYIISSCNFISNSGSNNPYDAVVRVWSTNPAVVIFENCYFENSQTRSSSTQIFAENKHQLFFYYNNTFNISRLDTERSIITFTTNKPSGGNRNLRIRGDLKVLCPYGYVIAANNYCHEARNNKYIECAYFSASCKLCPRNTYSVTRAVLHNNVTNEIYCRNCVSGGQCFQGRLTAKPNFWGYKTNQSVRFLQCPGDYCCQTNDCASYDSCHGDRFGTVCGQCPDSMSESLFSTDCIPNHKCGNVVVWPMALSLCMCYLLFFLYHEEIVKLIVKITFIPRRVAENSNDPSSCDCSSKNSGMLKVLFYYCQVVHLLRHSVGSQKKNTFVDEIENIFSSVFNFVVVGVSSLKCPIPNLRPIEKQILLHSMGFALLGLLGILYTIIRFLLNHLRRFKSQVVGPHNVTPSNQTPEAASSSRFTSRIISAFTYTSLLMYSSSTKLCLTLLHCVHVGNKEVLFLDGNINCYQTFQYFLLAYMISSIIPFCLVPVLGSYLLKFGLIGVNQYCAACIFPLPFCCFWMYLFLRDLIYKRRYVSLESDNDVRESCKGIRNSEVVILPANDNRVSILRVLLGPFRDHKSKKLFLGCPIPWEGFLTFRRLSIIIALTFINDIRLKMILVLILCVAILVCHMYAKPFHNSRDNHLETASLCTHIILCGLVMIRNLCYGSEVTSTSNFALLKALHLLESILVVLPMAIISLSVLASLLIRIVLILRRCMQFVCNSMIKLNVRQMNRQQSLPFIAE